MTNTSPQARERIELPGGWHFLQQGRESSWYQLRMPTGNTPPIPWTSEEAHAFAAALSAPRDPQDKPGEAAGAGVAPWQCGALRQGTAGGNDPADCNWPVCGCDPYASKVIEALQESGVLQDAPREPAAAGAGVTVTDEMVEAAIKTLLPIDDLRADMRDALNAALALAATAQPQVPASTNDRLFADLDRPLLIIRIDGDQVSIQEGAGRPSLREVLDEAKGQPLSPELVRIYGDYLASQKTPQPQGTAVPEEHSGPAFDNGVTHAIGLLAKMLGVEQWHIRDGSDDYDNDVRDTILGVLIAAKLYDDEDGCWATLPLLAAAPPATGAGSEVDVGPHKTDWCPACKRGWSWVDGKVHAQDQAALAGERERSAGLQRTIRSLERQNDEVHALLVHQRQRSAGLEAERDEWKRAAYAEPDEQTREARALILEAGRLLKPKVDAEKRAQVLEAERDGLREALDQFLVACEADFGVPSEQDGDDEPVATGTHGPSKVTFGHLREARKAVDGGSIPPWRGLGEIVAAEREACAQIADSYGREGEWVAKEYAAETADELAARIRARAALSGSGAEAGGQDAARYRYLRDHCSYSYPEDRIDPSPAECGISWGWQQTKPGESANFDRLIDRDIERQAKLDSEDDEAPPPAPAAEGAT